MVDLFPGHRIMSLRSQTNNIDMVNLFPNQIVPMSSVVPNQSSSTHGRDKVFDLAREAIDIRDFQWAAELLTWIIRTNLNDSEARSLKAHALRQWAYEQKNATWRNWG